MSKLAESLLVLLLFITTDASRPVYGQRETGKTLSTHLREFRDRYKLKISFSPSITDQIYPAPGVPDIPRTKSDPGKALTKLLKDSGMTYKRVGITYTIIRDPHSEPVVLSAQISEPPPRTESAKDTVAVKSPPPGRSHDGCHFAARVTTSI